MTAANFDPVARVYRWLEYAAFGRALERTRFVHLGHLTGCRDILLLGDGDGRTLARIVAGLPSTRIVSVDASRAMLRLAEQRIPAAARRRVTFVHADGRSLAPAGDSYDAVVTQFFLDCFTPEEHARLIQAVAPAVRDHGLWLFADFVIPEGGLRRMTAELVTSSLYRFFRWGTHLAARHLPPSEREIRSAGFVPLAEASFRGALLRSVVFQKRT